MKPRGGSGPMTEQHLIVDRSVWLNEWRDEAWVTASNIGALKGVHPNTTTRRLYLAAKGVHIPQKTNRAMGRGNRFEAAIPAAVMDERPGWSVAYANLWLFDPELKLGGTPDFIAYDSSNQKIMLEGKTVSSLSLKENWDDGNCVPEHYRLQVVACAFLAIEAGIDIKGAAVAALVVDPFRDDCYIFDVPLIQKEWNELRHLAAQFHSDVIHNREPAPDFEKDADLIKALAPHEIPGHLLDLSGDNEMPVLLARHAALKDEIKQRDTEMDIIETELRYRMGKAESIIGLPGWRVTWKTQTTKEYTVAARSNRVLRIFDKRSQQAKVA
jgi:predicted phage-related endonuclease